MAIAVGEKIPSATLYEMTDEGPAAVTTDDLFGGKKVIMFGLPGAFTPVCSARHLPEFVEKADEVKAKGADEIVCFSVNDAFVMGAWGEDQKVGKKVRMIGDGAADLTKKLGVELDLTSRGLGLRCDRFLMIVEDGKVTFFQNEEQDAPGTLEKTSVEVAVANL